MFKYMFFLQLVLFVYIEYSLSLPTEVSNLPWLPKCCPKGNQMATDGKSCIEDDTDYAEYNTTDNYLETSPDILTIDHENGTVFYKLEHRSEFTCVKHELYLINDDVFVMSDGSVFIYDGLGSNWTLPLAELCVDSVSIPQAGRVFIALLCPSCQRLPCVHKCCSDSRMLNISEDGSNVDCMDFDGPSWTQELEENNSDRPFVFHGFPKCDNSPYLEFPDQTPQISEHGHLRLRQTTIPRAEYCGDYSERGFALLGCRQMLPSSAIKPVLYGGLFCLGAVFLGVTLGLHVWLPELRKTLHSRVVIAHVTCLLASYIGLAIVNLAPLPSPSTVCSATAFVIQFGVLASIFWLNVMCVDIAWTFSGLRVPKASDNLDSDGHKFLYYSLYAWGSTAAISGVTAFLEYCPMIPTTSRFKPSFGITRCWFMYSESILLLVYGPMGVLLLVNIVLFVYTAYKIQRTRQDTANLVQHAGTKLRENKDRFSLYLKLFGLMGVTWVFEVVSWLVGGSESYWYITDIINCLRSVFIFALFCLKKKVLVLIKAKFSPKKTPKYPIHPRKSTSSKMSSSMTSQRTNSIQLSQIS